MAKKKSSLYLTGKRSATWLKVKNYQEALVNVFGYKKRDGAVLVGTGDKHQGYAMGMGSKDRAVLRELLDQYGNNRGDSIWLPAGVRGRVKFTTWTARGNMRDCSWAGFDV